MYAGHLPEDLQYAKGLIHCPYRILNITAYCEDFSTKLGQIPSRLGQPWPVFKCKWGLECFEVEAVKNFELK